MDYHLRFASMAIPAGDFKRKRLSPDMLGLPSSLRFDGDPGGGLQTEKAESRLVGTAALFFNFAY
jgi:hypothetical protein